MKDREYLNEAAKAVDAKLPDNTGFILLAIQPDTEGGHRLAYTSSLNRELAILVLKEWLLKAGAEEDWMKHIR